MCCNFIQLKRVLKLFLPDFFLILITLIKSFIYYKKSKKYNSILHDEKRVILIGNGPSLQETIKEHLDILKNNSCAVVNSFVSTQLFGIIKPKYYLLVDPVFYLEDNLLEGRVKEIVYTVRDSLLKKVSWPIIFILPQNAKNTKTYDILKSINNSKFIFFNNNVREDYIPNSKLKYILWNHDAISPLAMNVLNAGLTVFTALKVKDIYLVGADSSWITTYEVDQKNNILYCRDEHFYGVRRIPIYKDSESKIPSHLHDELKFVSTALYSYWVLKDFADYNGVNIYNSSAYSWIDAFERKSLDTLR